jgi:hypothetical protein
MLVLRIHVHSLELWSNLAGDLYWDYVVAKVKPNGRTAVTNEAALFFLKTIRPNFHFVLTMEIEPQSVFFHWFLLANSS